MKNNLFLLAQKRALFLKKLLPQKIRFELKDKIIKNGIDRFLREKNMYPQERYARGVNLIGNIRAEMGLGQSCRLVARQLELSDYDFSVYPVGFSGKLRENDLTYEQYISKKLLYGINIFHVNPCEIGQVFLENPELWRGRYNVAFWLWELEEFPDEWVKYCDLFDEIWTPSDFAGKGIREKTNIPVKTLPYSVSVPTIDGLSRKDFGLPAKKFLFLVMFDSNSTMERKNPMGAVGAYKKAFETEEENCGLIIKINNAREKDIAALKKELKGYRNVYFITGVLEKAQVNCLIRSADALISLHRSEGFGLVMAEAMLLGTPVVATNWSSNTEFMTEAAACMVGYSLVSNAVTSGMYKKGCVWAEPDMAEASEFIRRLYKDKDYYENKKSEGKKCIENTLNPQKITRQWNRFLKDIIEMGDSI